MFWIPSLDAIALLLLEDNAIDPHKTSDYSVPISLSLETLVLVTRLGCVLACLVDQAILKLGITVLPQLPEQWNYKGALSHLVSIYKLLFFLRQDLIYPRLASTSQRIILSFWLHPSSADVTGLCYHAWFIKGLGSNPEFQA